MSLRSLCGTWHTARQALLAYKALYGDLQVPKAFVVPEDPTFPEELWGMCLGAETQRIRNKRKFKEHRAELEDMGFDFAVQNGASLRSLCGTWRTARQALLAYKALYGDLQVPKAFVVPEDPTFPEKLWGVCLGAETQRIREKRKFKQHRAELEDMGFDFAVQNGQNWAAVKLAFLTYKSLYGDLLVPDWFVVPDEPPWPPHLHGMRLGRNRVSIRHMNYFAKHRAELEEMGFDFSVRRNHRKAGLLA